MINLGRPKTPQRYNAEWMDSAEYRVNIGGQNLKVVDPARVKITTNDKWTNYIANMRGMNPLGAASMSAGGPIVQGQSLASAQRMVGGGSIASHAPKVNIAGAAPNYVNINGKRTNLADPVALRDSLGIATTYTQGSINSVLRGQKQGRQSEKDKLAVQLVEAGIIDISAVSPAAQLQIADAAKKAHKVDMAPSGPAKTAGLMFTAIGIATGNPWIGLAVGAFAGGVSSDWDTGAVAKGAITGYAGASAMGGVYGNMGRSAASGASGMSGASAWLDLGATALGLYGDYVAYEGQSEAADASRQAGIYNAQLTELDTGQQLKVHRQNLRTMLGAQTAAAAASGVRVSSGSTREVQLETVFRSAMDERYIRAAADAKKRVQIWGGEVQGDALDTAATGTLLTGLTRVPALIEGIRNVR